MSEKIDPTVSAIGGGVATYGKIRAVFGAIFATLIIIVLIAFGVDRLNDKHTAKVSGTVTAITTPPGCTSSVNDKVTTYSCPVTVGYSVDGKSYTITQTIGDTKATVVGQQVDVQYVPSDPSDALVEFPPKSMAYLLFGAAALVFVIVLVNTILVFKSQAYATVSGGIGIVDLMRR